VNRGDGTRRLPLADEIPFADTLTGGQRTEQQAGNQDSFAPRTVFPTCCPAHSSLW
jgi:hypothetical protein